MRTVSLFILAGLAGCLGIYVFAQGIRLRLLSLLIIAGLIFFICVVLIRAGIGFTNWDLEMRTIQDALARADTLRDFRKVNESAFEKSEDFQDIVNLADEVHNLRSQWNRRFEHRADTHDKVTAAAAREGITVYDGGCDICRAGSVSKLPSESIWYFLIRDS